MLHNKTKAQFVRGSLCMVLTISFLMFCVPLSIVGRLVAMFSYNLKLGAHRGPDGADSADQWPLADGELPGFRIGLISVSALRLSRVNRVWN